MRIGQHTPAAYQHGDNMVGIRQNSDCQTKSVAGLSCVAAMLAVISFLPNKVVAQTSSPFAEERGSHRRPATKSDRPNIATKRIAERPQSRFSDARPITPSAGRPAAKDGKGTGSRSGPSLWKTFGTLGLIVTVIVVAGRMWKKHGSKFTGGLPIEAIDVLGKRNIDARQAIYLVRLGSRILVLGSTANGLRTLSEVTDPVEVDYLAGLSRRSDADGGVAQSFRALFSGQNVLSNDQQSAAPSNTQSFTEPLPQERVTASSGLPASGRTHD